MQRLSPKFWSQQFFLWKICGETFPQIYRDLYGDAMLVPIEMVTNMAAENQQTHLLLQKREFISRRTKNRNNNTLL